jgi:MFS family permease
MGYAIAATMPRRLSTFEQILLSVYWFATNMHWAAILVILVPLQVLQLVGDVHKGTGLGIVSSLGAIVALVFPPIIGAISDRLTSPYGRRHPFMVVGTLINVAGLLVLALAGNFILYVIAYLIVEFGNNMATAPYSALIPDQVPREQRGSASGWMGLMTMLGNVAGGMLGILLAVVGGVVGAYVIIMVVMVLGMIITVTGVRERQVPPRPTMTARAFLRSVVEALRTLDFFWVTMTRLLVMMGVYTVQGFLLYYFRDVVGAPFSFFGIHLAEAPEGATSFFIIFLLLGATMTTLVAGQLSDRYGRKIMVYAAGYLMAVVAGVFILFQSFTLAMVMGIVFGLGYGAYTSVDWALATDVLPSMDDYAKDMGIWHAATVVPQIIAAPVAGILLDTFQQVGKGAGLPTLGYVVIFLIAVVYFILGTIFVRKIKKVR